MSRRIFATPLADLLPESIRSDAGIDAAAKAMDPALRGLVLGVPDVLLFARLDPAPGRLNPVMQRLVESSGGLAPLSTAELELLAWQFHVDFREVATTNHELAALVRDSIPSHRVKGTPASLRQALALFGLSAEIQESVVGRHWASYQLGLSEIADMDTVRRVTAIAREMAPVRCRLGRLYNSIFDFRPAVWGVDKWADAWWSLHSGVHVPDMPGTDEDFIVSFGRRLSLIAETYNPRCSMGMASLLSCIAPYLDRATWGRTPWGAILPGNHPFIFSQLYGSYFGDALYDPPRIDRIRPLWSMGGNAISRSQSVGGEAGKLWSDTACYGTRTVRHIDAPAVWTAAAWGDSQGLWQEVLHELTMRRSAGLAPVQPGVPSFGHMAHSAFRLARHDINQWGVTPWGVVLPFNRPFFGHSTTSSYFAKARMQSRPWGGAWGGPWRIFLGLHRPLPLWNMGGVDISKSQSVGGEAGKLWSDTSCYGTRMVQHIDAPAMWTQSAWGDSQGLRQEVVHELALRRSAGLAPVQPGVPSFGAMAHRAFCFARHDVAPWGVATWGGEQLANRPMLMASLHSSYFGQRSTLPRRWGGRWGGPWQIYVGLHRPLPPWHMGGIAISRAQAVSGEAGKAWGHAAYGTRVERRIDAPQSWGAAAWGADQGLRYETITELP